MSATPEHAETQLKLVVITGLSGSGKSIALHTLEDLGYNCIDNLPMFLLQELARRLMDKRDPAFARTAVGIDARNAPESLCQLPALVRELTAQGIACPIVFLDAQAETLSRRFSETRRKHPLASGQRSLEEAMALERRWLEPIFAVADWHLDTTYSTLHQLRDHIRQRLEPNVSPLSLLLVSFGFKHGAPRDADFIFDVRCLPNPYWDPQLRPLNGRDAPVIAFLAAHPEVTDMLEYLQCFLDRWLPAFEAEGRSYLTLALGCTGGQHRSVYLAEALGQYLMRQGRAVLVRHREGPA